jgi:hypothetical protein
MRTPIWVVVALMLGIVPPAASVQAQPEVDYDTFMKQDVQGRIRTFNQISPENRAALVRTQIQRWIEKNKAGLTLEQLSMMNENLGFITPDRYRGTMSAEDMARAKELQTRTAAVFSEDEMRQALTIQADYIPKKDLPPADAVPSVAQAVPPRFAIVDEDGNPIFTDAQISGYEWATHTLILQPGVTLDGTIKQRQRLVGGLPFSVVVDGITCYRGAVTTSNSSIPLSVPVINVQPLDRKDGVVRIELGYPDRTFFRGEDPRGDERVRRTLLALGKLRE